MTRFVETDNGFKWGDIEITFTDFSGGEEWPGDICSILYLFKINLDIDPVGANWRSTKELFELTLTEVEAENYYIENYVDQKDEDQFYKELEEAEGEYGDVNILNYLEQKYGGVDEILDELAYKKFIEEDEIEEQLIEIYGLDDIEELKNYKIIK